MKPDFMFNRIHGRLTSLVRALHRVCMVKEKERIPEFRNLCEYKLRVLFLELRVCLNIIKFCTFQTLYNQQNSFFNEILRTLNTYRIQE